MNFRKFLSWVFGMATAPPAPHLTHMLLTLLSFCLTSLRLTILVFLGQCLFTRFKH